MGADDFRDYMPPFLFLRSISDNYHAATKKELGTDYPAVGGGTRQLCYFLVRFDALIYFMRRHR